MSSILGPIQRLGILLTGLSSDLGDVIQVQWTATPDQPESPDFPALVIEVDPGSENLFQTHSLGGAHNIYKLNIMILVGVPAAGTPMGELHDRACAWVYPLAERIFSNITLSGVDNTLVMGYGGVEDGSEDIFHWQIQGIEWNQKLFYGLRVSTWIKEDMTLAMA